jgi:hypothetical protein
MNFIRRTNVVSEKSVGGIEGWDVKPIDPDLPAGGGGSLI